MKKIISIITLVLLCGSIAYAQGEVFTAQEAEVNWGKADQKIKIATETLKRWIENEDYIMFKIVNNRLSVLGEERKNLAGNFTAKADDVYAVYSSKVVAELLKKGGEDVSYIETRNGVTTVTNGTYTMEMSYPCPPCCPKCKD